ncbi:MAG: glycoside hydrolase family 11 protein [Treponema sp.]|nr:glycoside hydrolase family 11 protein [Treponema sp.]
MIIAFAFAACADNNSNGSGNGNSNNNGGGAETEFTGRVITGNERGTSNGYDYEFWKNANASGRMTLGSGGNFSCEWATNGSGSNILFRSGKRFGSTQTYSQVGNITIRYTAVFTPGNGGASYLSVYCWTQNPLVEFYIVDNYLGGYHPGSSGALKGTFTVNGEGTYNVYTREMRNAPAIQGSGVYNFTQYISVRTQKRTSGTISVSEHFRKWEELGLDMSGKLYEAMMKVEGYQNAGTAQLTENVITIE